MLTLSVLDQSIACAGRGEDEAIRDSVAQAVQCEALGYARYWLSEHHGLPTTVGTAPEVLMAAIAVRTSRIRIGSAGVMLPHYSALKVAEQFRVLEALAPGRIDLGVGRAPAADRRTALALNPDAANAADHYAQQVADLRAWTSIDAHQGITAHPRGPHAPQVWVLGSSDHGAQLAAHLGLPYAYAYFFSDGQGVEQALDLYRRLYRPSERHPKPQATICVWALAADSRQEAEHHALSRDRWRLDRARGLMGPLRVPDEIAERGFSTDELQTLVPLRRRALVGTANDVADRLHGLAAVHGLDEIVVNTWAHDPRARRHSFALLADALALDGRPRAGPETEPCD